MKYCKNYCEEEGISTSKLNEAQRTLYYIAENMKMDKSISEEGYRHFQMAIEALKGEPCEDCVSRTAVIELAKKGTLISNGNFKSVCEAINNLPRVCESCKYYDGRGGCLDSCALCRYTPKQTATKEGDGE